MRKITPSLILLAAALAAQGAGIQGFVQNKLNDAVNDHDQAVNDALGDNKPAAPVAAADAVKAGWLTRKSKDGKDVKIYFATPANIGKGKPVPALLVLQESWGLNDEMQQRTRDFAAKGFYAVAPDLFNGQTTDDPAKAKQLEASMTPASAMTAMKTSLDLLDEESRNNAVDPKHVGAIGWGLGGREALLLATSDARIQALAIFYGPLKTDPAQLKNLQGPTLIIGGAQDITNIDFATIQGNFNTANMTVKEISIPNAGNGFASTSTKSGAYNEAKANQVTTQLWAWLDETLPR